MIPWLPSALKASMWGRLGAEPVSFMQKLRDPPPRSTTSGVAFTADRPMRASPR